MKREKVGGKKSDEKFGWLDPDRYPEGAWGIHRSTVGLKDNNNFDGRHRRSREIINYGNDSHYSLQLTQ